MNDKVTDDARAHIFALAFDIYVAGVSEKTAAYPINVEGPIRSTLDAVFARAVPEGKFAWTLHFDPFKKACNQNLLGRKGPLCCKILAPPQEKRYITSSKASVGNT